MRLSFVKGKAILWASAFAVFYQFRLRHLPSHRKGQGLLSPFRLYSRKNSSERIDTFISFRVHFSYFKLLIRLVTSFVEYFFFLSLFFQKRREFGRDCSREAIDGSQPTEFDLTHSESSIYPSCDYLQFATYNWCNSRGRSIPLFDRMPLKLVQNFIDQHGSYILTCPNLYFLCIYLCYYTNERLKFHGRHGLRTTIIEGTIVERFVDFERERERVHETCIISNTSSLPNYKLTELQRDGHRYYTVLMIFV